MAPRKRVHNTASTTEEQKKLIVIQTDFDKQQTTRVNDIEREAKNLSKQLHSFYLAEICKLPKATRETKVDKYLTDKMQSLMESLGKIEEEINLAIQLPAIGKKLRSGTKPLPPSVQRAVVAKPTPLSAALPPAPPSKSTVRKKRQNTEPVDMETVEEVVVVKKEQIVTRTRVVVSTPLPEVGSNSTAVDDRTFNFDDVSPERVNSDGEFENAMADTATTQPEAYLDIPSTLKKEDVNENIPFSMRKNLTTATVCRKPVANELLWSAHGSPVVMDPRTALKQSKVHAAISVKHGSITLTDSPMTNDPEKCPQLEPTDIDMWKKLQAKMSKMIEINEIRANSEADGPGTSSQ